VARAGASLIPPFPLDIVMSSWFGGGARDVRAPSRRRFAFVAAIGIAVVRYRLYAIERLVNRTLVYVTLTLLLLAVYAAITIGLGVVVGGDSAWVVALATLVVALAFRPLRARIQDLVDRRYRRARYEGVRRVRAFEDEVRDGARAPEDGVVLADALQDPLRRCSSDRRTGAYADTTKQLTSPARRATRHDHRDDTRRPCCCTSGCSTTDLSTVPARRLRSRWRGCASRCAAARQVQASRARIIEAGYEAQAPRTRSA
jgi:hypothetical protein